MLDFYEILYSKKGRDPNTYHEVYPNFKTNRVNDLMVRGGGFYAIWNPDTGLWSKDDYDVPTIVDKELRAYADDLVVEKGLPVRIRTLQSFSSGSWTQFRQVCKHLADNYQPLDSVIMFSNSEVKKGDYVTGRLEYPLEEGSTKSFDTLFEVLYDEENLNKLLWAIGSVIHGDSKTIQKFYVLFGAPGTGKSTSLNLIEELLGPYVQNFESGELGNPNNRFSLSRFLNNPLVGIDHEGDLSKIGKNSTIASVVSHDKVVLEVKYQQAFGLRLNTTLFIATNKPVMITERNSGLIRRLIDIRPTGNVVSIRDYDSLVNQTRFELGAIAYKCLQVYKTLGKE